MAPTDAWAAVWLPLDAVEKEYVQGRLGCSMTSCYQKGEYDDQGNPRMRISANDVAVFCAATNNTLLLDVVVSQTRRAMAEAANSGEGVRRPYTSHEVLARVEAPLHTLIELLGGDGALCADDRDAVKKALHRALDAVHNHGNDGLYEFPGRVATLGETAEV